MLDTNAAEVAYTTTTCGSIVHNDVNVVPEGLDSLGHNFARELLGITAICLDGDGLGISGSLNSLERVLSSLSRSGVSQGHMGTTVGKLFCDASTNSYHNIEVNS